MWLVLLLVLFGLFLYRKRALFLAKYGPTLQLSVYEALCLNNLFMKYAKMLVSFMILVVAQPTNSLLVKQLVRNMDEDFLYRVFAPRMTNAILADGHMTHLEAEKIYFKSLGAHRKVDKKTDHIRTYAPAAITGAILYVATFDCPFDEVFVVNSTSAILAGFMCLRANRKRPLVNYFYHRSPLLMGIRT